MSFGGERRFTIIDNLAFDQGRTSGSLDMKGPRNSVWTSSFLRINEEGKLVGRHLDFFGSTDLLRSSMGMHIPNATSLEDLRISDAPETELGVDFCLTWNIDPRWVFIVFIVSLDTKSPINSHLEFNRIQTH